jgi:hypothetical protein
VRSCSRSPLLSETDELPGAKPQDVFRRTADPLADLPGGFSLGQTDDGIIPYDAECEPSRRAADARGHFLTAVPSAEQCRMNRREHNRRTVWLAQCGTLKPERREPIGNGYRGFFTPLVDE